MRDRYFVALTIITIRIQSPEADAKTVIDATIYPCVETDMRVQRELHATKRKVVETECLSYSPKRAQKVKQCQSE